ncbi:MAG: hypothetical protein EOO13_09095 [Chitinophagaceae bacterium]|nr:MAG: hypothetical protein EOO13_09095 [Chitinophagaceae bacterium]
MLKWAVYSFLLASIFCACNFNKQPSYNLDLEDSKLLPNISSGSGIILRNQKVFIVSDNMNGYFSMDTSTSTQQFYSFNNDDSAYIQEKNIKEDFESASIILINGEENILAVSSGSIDSSRQQLLIFPIKAPQNNKIVKAIWLYDIIKQDLKISTSQLNIEGAFTARDSLYLLNRGTNQAIAIPLVSLQNQLEEEPFVQPAARVTSFSLPLLDGFPVAFSGACYYKEDTFLFTASVEKTNDWVADGEVAGSYIGMAKLDGTVLFLLPLLDRKGNRIKQKLESLDIIHQQANGNIALFAISDNDNGQSTWFRLTLHLE